MHDKVYFLKVGGGLLALLGTLLGGEGKVLKASLHQMQKENDGTSDRCLSHTLSMISHACS